jgi:chorismate synthase
MIHFVLHDRQDCVAVVVVEGVKAGMKLKGWIMDEDLGHRQAGHPHRPQGGLEEDGRG